VARRAPLSTFVVLLRGVNVGKGNRLPMATFRGLLESLGQSDVRTLLNSGNAVCRGAARASAPLAMAIHEALRTSLGMDVQVVVKLASELDAIVAHNPLASACTDASRLLVVFAQERAAWRSLASLSALVELPDRFAVGTHAAYAHCPKGILKGQVGSALLGAQGKHVTTRNWATVLKLHALSTGDER
jgi:uncharacterized protein (DUF1697 family)